MSPAPGYFELRRVEADLYRSYELPAYLARRLPRDPDALIVDFGCGYGQVLQALRRAGRRAIGVDIEPAALDACRAAGLEVIDHRNAGALDDLKGRAALVVASHVLEHFPKERIIETAAALRGLLAPGGALLAAVPNAQSATGSYWAYEDFTHEYLFTSGSLYYVLRAAGFGEVEFIDVDCLEGLPAWKRLVRGALLGLYKANYRFWNRVTASATHAPSPDVFSYEIKALARN